MENKDLDLFKKQLEKLLLKFPELPEFTLTIRPRVSIETNNHLIGNYPKTVVATIPSTSNLNVLDINSKITPVGKDDPNIPQSLESGITKSRINSLKASREIE